MYTVIPIFKDPNLHPLHKNNGLSALWCQAESAEPPFFIIKKSLFFSNKCYILRYNVLCYTYIQRPKPTSIT